MLFLALFTLFGTAVAQQCNCFRDETNGFWQGATCAQCFNSPTSPIDPTQSITTCNLVDACKSSSAPQRELTCYGTRLCNPTDPTAACVCPINLNESTYCEACNPGWTNWPACITPACNAATTCNDHGTCDDSVYDIACGVNAGGGPLAYRPDLESCSKGKEFDTISVKGAQPLALGVTTCPTPANPNFQCPFGSECLGSGDAKVCCFEYEAVCESADKLTSNCCGVGETCCDGTCCSGQQTCAVDMTMSTVPCPNEGCWELNLGYNANIDPIDEVFGTANDAEICQSYCAAHSKCRAFNFAFPNCELISAEGVKAGKFAAFGWRSGPRTCPAGTWACGGGASNGWKMKDGSTLEAPPMTCQQGMSALSVTRTVIFPACLMVGMVAGLGLVFATTGMGPIMLGIPAVALVVLCLFLAVTRYYSTAIIIAMTSYVAMGAAHKGGNALLVALLIEVFALGAVLGIFLTDVNGNGIVGLFPSYVQSENRGGAQIWGEYTACVNHFGTFNVNGLTRPWDVPADRDTISLCSEGWYSYFGVCTALIVMFQCILVVATGLSWVKGSPAMK